VKSLLKVVYQIFRAGSGLQRWARRKFTNTGIAFLCALAIAGVMSVDTENTVAYQGFTLVLFLVLISLGFNWFFKAPFSAERLLPRFGTVGQSFRYRVRATNLSGRAQGGLMLIEDLPDSRPSFADWWAMIVADNRRMRSFRVGPSRDRNPFRPALTADSELPKAPAHQQVETFLELTPLRRGALRLGGLLLARTDPFGLFRSLRRVPMREQSVLILPKRYPIHRVPLPGLVKHQEGGVALASNVGQSDEFVSLRDYRRGDPLRHIHWRSWAKAGKPIVKEFEDEFFVRHALVLDTFSADPHGEAFEEAVSLAASFACTIPSQESLLDLLFVGQSAYCFTAGRGLAHADQMLEILAAVRPCTDLKFSALEHLVLDHVPVLSGCICVFQSWDVPRQQFVQKLKALNVPVVVMVVVGPGEKASLPPGPMRDDPRGFHVLEAGRIEEGLGRIEST
jgi:uncharacterized protein (DUF58 family)